MSNPNNPPEEPKAKTAFELLETNPADLEIEDVQTAISTLEKARAGVALFEASSGIEPGKLDKKLEEMKKHRDQHYQNLAERGDGI